MVCLWLIIYFVSQVSIIIWLCQTYSLESLDLLGDSTSYDNQSLIQSTFALLISLMVKFLAKSSNLVWWIPLSSQTQSLLWRYESLLYWWLNQPLRRRFIWLKNINADVWKCHHIVHWIVADCNLVAINILKSSDFFWKWLIMCVKCTICWLFRRSYQ